MLDMISKLMIKLIFPQYGWNVLTFSQFESHRTIVKNVEKSLLFIVNIFSNENPSTKVQIFFLDLNTRNFVGLETEIDSYIYVVFKLQAL
jgi:hypothetical protein